MKLALALVSVMACEPFGAAVETRSRAITNASIDDGDPEVVALLWGDALLCTGTLIAPDVVLTAGHCLVHQKPTAAFFGASVGGAGTTLAVVETRVHPAFDAQSLANDVGLVRLAGAAPVSPKRLLRGSMDAGFAGAPVRLVGFGLVGLDMGSDGHKRSGATRIVDVQERAFTFAPAPSQTCLGDSGGPALIEQDGREVVAGVASYGDPSCSSFAVDVRVDTYVADFIDPYLESSGCSAGPAGAPMPAPFGVGILVLVAGAICRRRCPNRAIDRHCAALLWALFAGACADDFEPAALETARAPVTADTRCPGRTLVQSYAKPPPAQYSIFCCQAGPTFQRPFLVVPSFDPTNTEHPAGTEQRIAPFLSDLGGAGIDYCVMDWANGNAGLVDGDSTGDLANQVVAVLNWLYYDMTTDEPAGGSYYDPSAAPKYVKRRRPAVLGLSLGGVAAVAAEARRARQGAPATTSVIITWDSPMEGARVHTYLQDQVWRGDDDESKAFLRSRPATDLLRQYLPCDGCTETSSSFNAYFNRFQANSGTGYGIPPHNYVKVVELANAPEGVAQRCYGPGDPRLCDDPTGFYPHVHYVGEKHFQISIPIFVDHKGFLQAEDLEPGSTFARPINSGYDFHWYATGTFVPTYSSLHRATGARVWDYRAAGKIHHHEDAPAENVSVAVAYLWEFLYYDADGYLGTGWRGGNKNPRDTNNADPSVP